MTISIHPAVDQGMKPAAKNFAGGTLICHCPDKKVAVAIDSQCAHNLCAGAPSAGSRRARCSPRSQSCHAAKSV
jgi:hypothetical protein